MDGHSNHATITSAVKSSSRTITDQTNKDSDALADKTSLWVKSLSTKPLTGTQECLLAHGPKFATSSKHPPIGEYIATIQQVCSKLNQREAEELRVEAKKVLKKAQRPPANITKEEFKAINELKGDDNRMIFTTDKGVALVVFDKADYIKKAEELLNKPTYKKIPEDPTDRQKTKLINLLKNIKAEGGINEETYKRLYPTGAGSPNVYGLLNIHKPGITLRPIVSSRGTVTPSTAKELAKILKLLVEMSADHVHNTKDFVKHLKGIRLQQDECIISYDVKALFTSVPIHPVVKIIKNKLANDKDLQQGTTMAIQHIISLLEFCLRSTCFVFQGQYYDQIEGAAMGSPLSPIVANIFIEDFETKALETAPHPPTLWKRFVDDTFVVTKAAYKEEFFQHINSIDKNIQFTAENTRADGAMPFLYTLAISQNDGSLLTTVYRKPTHTDQYLQWHSNHAISSKYSVISTLMQRVKDVCSTKQQLGEEHTHIQKVLTSCKYPGWALNRMKNKTSAPIKSTNNNKKGKNSKTINGRNYITVPYMKGLSESINNTCKKYGTQVYFKSGKTIKDLLVAPKDKEHITKKSGIIYRYKCDRLECNKECIGEAARTFGERFREHLKAPSPIYDHYNITSHTITLEYFSIVGREDQNLIRLIKESTYIRVNNTSMNRNIGKYHLPHIWDEVLLNNTKLKLK